MTTETGNSLPSAVRSEVSRRSIRSFHSLRLLNGSVHWISAVVLVYAFISNGETTHALINPAAMRGEVKLGLIVGGIFLIRFIWVQATRSGGGRWVGPPVRIPQSKIRRVTDSGIYLGVAASVVSGILIAYLRPGAVLIPESRGFTTSSAALNAVIDAHVFVSDALEWLCGFHSVYSLWHWLIKRTQWTRMAVAWLERAASATGRVAAMHLRRENFHLQGRLLSLGFDDIAGGPRQFTRAIFIPGTGKDAVPNDYHVLIQDNDSLTDKDLAFLGRHRSGLPEQSPPPFRHQAHPILCLQTVCRAVTCGRHLEKVVPQ